MAHPEHVATLDGLDRLTVALYRSGLAVAALGVGVVAAGHLLRSWGADVDAVPAGRLVITAGAALAVANLHLYDKRIRWLIGAFGWAGLLLQLLAGGSTDGWRGVVGLAGLGFVFAALSGLALKEQFCFKIPLLRLVPVLLATSLVPALAGVDAAAGALLAVAAVPMGVLAVAKWTQPLHFDIGRKDAYQI